MTARMNRSDRRLTNSSRGAHGSFPDGYRAVLIVVVVALIVTAVHWPGTHAKAWFTDDPQYLLNNSLVRNPGWASASRIVGEVTKPSSVEGYYQPLTMLSLMFDYATADQPLDPARYRATSTVLHGLNAGMVALLAWLLFRSSAAAVFAGLLFGLHPITVEAIIWVSERKTPLASLFGLISIVAYVAYAQKPRRWLYGGCILAFLLALLAKPIVVPLPLLMILLDYWPMGRIGNRKELVRSTVSKWPLLALSIVFAVITYVSQARSCATELPTAWHPLRAPLVACYNLCFHARNFIWPVDLFPFHPYVKPFSLAQPAYLVAILVVVVLAVSGWLGRYRVRGWTFALLFFFVGAFPTLGLIGFSTSVVQEKYAYLPSVGLWLAVTAAIAAVMKRVRPVPDRAIVVVICAAVTAAASVGVWRQQGFWRDNDSLYGHVLAQAPKAAILYLNYGVVCYDRGDYGEAARLAGEAVRLRPDNPDGHNNLGNALLALGRRAEAIEEFGAALGIAPLFSDAHVSLGYALAQQGQLAEAIDHYNQALAVRPNNVRALNNLGNALLNGGEVDRAIATFNRALLIDGQAAETHNNLANALVTAGRLEEAVGHYRQALAVAPNLGDVHYNLATILLRLGDKAAARDHVRRALAAFQQTGESAKAEIVRRKLDELK